MRDPKRMDRKQWQALDNASAEVARINSILIGLREDLRPGDVTSLFKDEWRPTHRGIYSPENKARFIKRTSVIMQQGESPIPVVVFETAKDFINVWHEREWDGCFTPIQQETDQ